MAYSQPNPYGPPNPHYEDYGAPRAATAQGYHDGYHQDHYGYDQYGANPYGTDSGYQQPPRSAGRTAYDANYHGPSNPYLDHQPPPQAGYGQPYVSARQPPPHQHGDGYGDPYAQQPYGAEPYGASNHRGNVSRPRAASRPKSPYRPQPDYDRPATSHGSRQPPRPGGPFGGPAGHDEYPPRPGTAPGSSTHRGPPNGFADYSDPYAGHYAGQTNGSRAHRDPYSQGYGPARDEMPNFGGTGMDTSRSKTPKGADLHVDSPGSGGLSHLNAPQNNKNPHYSTYTDEHIHYYVHEHPDARRANGASAPRDNVFEMPGDDAYTPQGPNGAHYGRGPPPQMNGGHPRGALGPNNRRPPPDGAVRQANGRPDQHGPPRDRTRPPPQDSKRPRRPPPPGMDPRQPPDGRRPPPDQRDPRRPRGPPPPGMRDHQGRPRDPRDLRGPPPPPGAPSDSRHRPPPGGERERRDKSRGPPPDRMGMGQPRSPPGGGPNGHGPPRSYTAPQQSSKAPEGREQGAGDFPNRSASFPSHVDGPGGPGQKPLPIRPGLQGPQGSNGQQPDRPTPVRQYDTNAAKGNVDRQPSKDGKRGSQPMTFDELSRLRAIAHTHPRSPKAQLKLAKGLVDASRVLPEEGTTGQPTKASQERYLGEAQQLVKRGSDYGDPESMFYYADCLGTGALLLRSDPAQAFALYQDAAKRGHPSAAYRTAVCCEIGEQDGGGTKKDTAKAVQWYDRAASLGDVPAMFKLGMIKLKGLLGTQQNMAEAVHWLQQASERADEENPHACHELALLCESPDNGEALPKDETKALELFTKAGKFGYKHSQFRLGQAWEYGLLGCPIEARNSIIWYTRAASQGEHQSELALSGWYLTGSEGILEQSDTEAYLWARKAVASRPPLAKALFALGYYTECGIGTQRHVGDAKFWYAKAAEQDFPNAQARIDELKRTGGRVTRPRERLSRSNPKQHEGDCVVM